MIKGKVTMAEADIAAAAEALEAWCKSQKLGPGQFALVACRILGAQIVRNNIDEPEQAIAATALIMSLLKTEVLEELKKPATEK